MKIIESRIADRQFTKLIRKSLNVGYFEFRKYLFDTAGTPQGSIISPIMANIFLHQLDEFVQKLKSDFDRGTKPRRTKIYRSKEHELAKAKKSGDPDKIVKAAKELRSVPSTDFHDPGYRRLSYVRYADD